MDVVVRGEQYEVLELIKKLAETYDVSYRSGYNYIDGEDSPLMLCKQITVTKKQE